jgi:hypothetical protein
MMIAKPDRQDLDAGCATPASKNPADVAHTAPGGVVTVRALAVLHLIEDHERRTVKLVSTTGVM